MRFEWEDYSTSDGSKLEFSLRAILGTSCLGFDEDIHKLSVTLAVYRRKPDTDVWGHSIDLERMGTFRAADLLEAKNIALQKAFAHLGERLFKIAQKKEQVHKQGWL